MALPQEIFPSIASVPPKEHVGLKASAFLLDLNLRKCWMQILVCKKKEEKIPGFLVGLAPRQARASYGERDSVFALGKVASLQRLRFSRMSTELGLFVVFPGVAAFSSFPRYIGEKIACFRHRFCHKLRIPLGILFVLGCFLLDNEEPAPPPTL